MLPPTPTKPVFEHHHDGFGVEHSRPRLSWRFLTSEETVDNWTQTAYEVEVTLLSRNVTKRYFVRGEDCVLVPWPAPELESRDQASVRVRCYGKPGNTDATDHELTPSTWSPEAAVEIGLLSREDWTASFVTSSTRIGKEEPLQPLRFRKEFSLPSDLGPVTRARLYVTSLGVFEPYINGKAASDECMAPGWTSYNHRLNYRVLDVSGLLNPAGPNAIAVEAAEGWYAGRLGVRGGSRFWYGGREIAILAQLEVGFKEGSQSWRLISDDSWLCAGSAIQTSEIYDGEAYDMRQEQRGWNDIETSGFEAEPFIPTKTLPWPGTKLVAPDSPPVRVVQTIYPQTLFYTPRGKLVIDFGQNLVGKLLVKSISLPRDSKVTFTHAEVLEQGELGTRPLRSAKCTDSIVSSGFELRDWSPRFTFHGFRYVQIDGWPTTPESALPPTENFAALVMHSDMKRRGHFSCSNPYVNKLHENVVWSMRGNFLSVPTDCPQRDERLGWTGDLQVFCPSAAFLYDTVGLLGNWLEDLAAEQLEEERNGIPPLVCPDVLHQNWPNVPRAVWDDVTVLTPNDLYLYSSDRDLLSRQFDSMQAWLDHGVDRGADGLWAFDTWQYGDWLDPTAPPENPGDGRTDDVLVADAYLVQVTLVFAQLCEVIGKTAQAEKYRTAADDLKRKFQYKYITPAGNLMSNTQTALSLAIQFKLFRHPEELGVATTNLRKLVRGARFRVATGFVGTPLIAHALTTVLQPQLAYRMLLEKRCPSWMYPVTMGATTIWERWDSMLPDGRINPGQMTSFNHYALGAVADWLHTSVGGISPLEPGWKTIRVRPVPGGNITNAEVSFEGPYGLIKCAWKLEEQTRFSMVLVVPPNSSARVTLPSEWAKNVADIGKEPSVVVGSGTHGFSCSVVLDEWPPKPISTASNPPEPADIAS